MSKISVVKVQQGSNITFFQTMPLYAFKLDSETCGLQISNAHKKDQTSNAIKEFLFLY